MMLAGIVMDALDVEALERFWSQATRGLTGGLQLRFTPTTAPKVGKNRLHLDLAGGPDGHAEVERLLALGATRLDIGQGDVPWEVLADPEGNEFCVLPQGQPGVLAERGLASICLDVAEDDCAEQFEFWRIRSGWSIAEQGLGYWRLRPAESSDFWFVMGPPAAPKTGRNRVRLEVHDPALHCGEFVDLAGNEFHVTN
jgi:hypothetical protein